MPVKFQLTGASGAIANAVAKLTCVKVGDTAGTVNRTDPAVTELPTVETLSPATMPQTNSKDFAGARELGGGAYQLTVNLGDGISRTVNLGLK